MNPIINISKANMKTNEECYSQILIGWYMKLTTENMKILVRIKNCYENFYENSYEIVMKLLVRIKNCLILVLILLN